MTAAAWQEEILARGELFRVGGSVRDHLLGSSDTPDTDFVVRGISPGDLEALLSRHGHVVYVGKAFGVYKFTPAGENIAYDIAFPRREQSTGVGHRDFHVQWDWTLPIEDDLSRRDFTINAIAEKLPEETLVDPTGGAKDLRAGVLRMIFPRAFEEDALRILRGARFAARLGLRVETETLARMRDAARLLGTISAERVRDEFTKTLTQCERAGDAFQFLQRIDGLAAWLPELDRCAGVTQNEFHPDDVFVHSLKTLDASPRANLLVRWAALMHDTGKVDARQVIHDGHRERVVFYGHEDVSARLTVTALERLRYPNAFVEDCRHLVQEHMFNYQPEWKPATLRRFMRRIGARHLDGLFLLREADCRSRALGAGVAELDDLRARVQAEFAARATLHVADLAVDGGDVMRVRKISAGPEVGRTLHELLERVTDEPALNERDALLKMLERWGTANRGE